MRIFQQFLIFTISLGFFITIGLLFMTKNSYALNGTYISLNAYNLAKDNPLAWVEFTVYYGDDSNKFQTRIDSNRFDVNIPNPNGQGFFGGGDVYDPIHRNDVYDLSSGKHYYIQYTAYKPQGLDVRDSGCIDPLVETIVNVPGYPFFSANVSFECHDGSQPPVSVTPAAPNSNVTQRCNGSNVDVDFTWTPATATGITLTRQVHDWNLDNGGNWNYQDVPVGTGSVTRTGLPANSTIYWRINTQASNGTWYTSSVYSFRTQGCVQPPTLNPATVTCATSGTNARVSFSWNRATGGTFDSQHLDYTLIANLGPDDPAWDANNPASQGYTVNVDVGTSATGYITSSFPDGGVTYYWRVNVHDASGWHPSSASSFTTPPCTPPSNLQATCMYSGSTLQIKFTWTPGNRPNLFVDVDKQGTYISGAFWNRDVSGQSNFYWDSARPLKLNTSGTYNYAPEPNTTYHWRLYDNVDHVDGGTFDTTAASCGQTQPVSPPPSTCKLGSVSGTRWGPPPNYELFRPANYPATTVSLTTGQSETSSTTPLSDTYTFDSVKPGTFTLSITGAPNYTVHAVVTTATGNTTYSTSAPGAGTAVRLDYTCGENYSVNFFFEQVPGPSTPPPTVGDIPVEFSTYCLNGVSYIKLTWQMEAGKNYNINRDSLGNLYAGSVTSPWISPPQNQNENHTWYVIDSSGRSGSKNGTSATCPSSPPVSSCTGTITGSKWTLYYDAPFVSPQFPGASAYVDSGSVAGISQATFTKTELTCSSHTVSVSGATGWQVQACVTGSATAGENGCTAFSQAGAGVAARATVAASMPSPPSVWFYFQEAQPPVSGPDIRGSIVLTRANGTRVDKNTAVVGEYVQPGERITAKLSFDEVNNIAASGFNGYFWQNRASSPYPCNTAGADKSYSNLSTNGTTSVTVDTVSFTAPLVEGRYRAWFYADGSCLVPEANETNNADGDYYTVGTPPTPPPAAAPDLAVGMTFNKSSYSPGETINVTVTTTNLGADINSDFKTGFYLSPSAALNDNCSGNPSADSERIIRHPFAAGAVDTWTFTLVAPPSGGTFTDYAFADYRCTIAESDETTNNITSKTYAVDVSAWFITTDGDLGSGASIGFSRAPGGAKQATFVTVAHSVDSSFKYGGWRLNNYTQPLIALSQSPYNYFATRFLQKAQANGGKCDLKNLDGGKLNYCIGDATYNGGSVADKAVLFVGGNLTITQNLTIGGPNTAVFIVKGDITIQTGVTRADGVYIAGGTFRDATDNNNKAGSQLVMDGAVYVQSLSLPRVLGGSCSSGPQCDNSQTPALVINFAPKYLVGISNLIGSSSVQWQEVAP